MSGAVLIVAEADYRYGAGELRLRVDVVDRPNGMHLDGELWVPVHGVRLRRDGTTVGPIRILVRAARLPDPPGR